MTQTGLLARAWGLDADPAFTGAGRPCSGIGGAEEEYCLRSSSPRLLHRVANGPNMMCLRIRSFRDPMSSSLNSPLFGTSHSGQLWTLLLLARVVFGIRQPNQSSNSALSDRDQGDGRPSLCGKESLKILLCRKRHQSGSRVLDPRTTTWNFTGPIERPRLHPTAIGRQR